MSETYRPPYRAALLVGLAVLALYVATLAPTTAFWDASEYIATAHILGIPHPPGNPLFVVLAKVWTLLLAPTGLSIAVRVNLFAAVTSATASVFMFLIAHRVIVGFVRGRPALVGAAASAIVGATTYTVWNQSTVNEKVYTVSVAVIMAVTWLALRWRDRLDEPGSERILLAALYLVVLGTANHLMSALPLPALLVFVVLVAPRVLVRPRFLARALPLVVLGLSFNFFLPVRAAERPIISEGEPICESFAGAAVAVFSMGRAGGCPALADVLTREQYQKPSLGQRMAPLDHQLLNWWQYFDWQWARGAHPAETPGNARTPFTLIFTLLGLVGLAVAWLRDREDGAYLTVLTATLTLGLVYYLNFEYGYSLTPEVTDATLHEVRERDYFFIAGFLLWGGLAGIGLTWTWSTLARAIPSPRRWILSAPLLALAVVPAALNHRWASRAGDYAAADWAFDLLMSVEPYGIIFTNGDNDTFPLWYLQEVEGLRRDVTVVVGQYLFTDWYVRQLQHFTEPERQRPYDPETAAGLYPETPRPTGPIVRGAAELLDAIRGGVIDRDVAFNASDLVIRYPAGTFLDRSERLALSIIRDSIEERPIYFASASGMMSRLGMERWAVRHGLAVKLEVRGLEEPEDRLVQVSPGLGGDWFDYERSMRLYHDVYRFRGLRDRDVWFDRATLNIPFHYYVLAIQLADAALQRGADAERVRRLTSDAEAFLTTADGGRLGSSTP